jgi:Lipopolysaccharide kinase (Kdo/WaaP) family
MRPATETQWRRDPNFTRLTIGRRVLILHRSVLRRAPEILERLREIAARPAAGAGGEGNRASAYRIDLDGGPQLIARRLRRGGLMRLLASDTFVGINPRPFRELAVAAEAARRTISVAEPAGALVQWLTPAVYRGFFLTRAIAGMTLWKFITTDDDPIVRNHVLLKARESVAIMHNLGLLHGDLNLHNLMVTQRGESFEVVILDLDKARLFDEPLPPKMRRSNAQRLLRSARKLDPAGRYFDAEALSILNVG